MTIVDVMPVSSTLLDVDVHYRFSSFNDYFTWLSMEEPWPLLKVHRRTPNRPWLHYCT
jgi:hypothetical protein